MLSEEEKYRYSRHIKLNEVGEVGQEKLKKARVLVIGAGGLGCPVLQYLTAAGIGTIGIIDFDKVELSNLQRQVLFTTNDVGKNKATAAKKRLIALNPLVNFQVYPERLTTKNAIELFKQFGIVIDCSDNFSTRYLVNDASIITNTPLVYGAVHKFEGQVSVFNYQNGPTYRCLYPAPPPEGSVPNCSDIGVLGVLPGLIGVRQSNEALKIILGIGKVLSGELLIINALTNETLKLTISKNRSEFDTVVQNKTEFENTNYDLFCGIQQVESEIDSSELKRLLKEQPISIIDVREPYELPKYEELNAQNIPLGTIGDCEIDFMLNEQIVVYCQHGIRSKNAIEILKTRGFKNLTNLKGGIVTWN